MEINEIIYHIAGQFWKQTYEHLLGKIDSTQIDETISQKAAIKLFRKELWNLAKRNNLSCSTYSHNGFYYLSIMPFPIYVGIDKSNGEINVATPHVNTMHFKYNEYTQALDWIQNYIDIDLVSLTSQINSAKERFYLNTKAADIVKISINSICMALSERNGFTYELKQNRLRSVILLKVNSDIFYEIEVYHKAFSQDSSILVNLLNAPHEVMLKDKISSYRVRNDFVLEDSAIKSTQEYISESLKK